MTKKNHSKELLFKLSGMGKLRKFRYYSSRFSTKKPAIMHSIVYSKSKGFFTPLDIFYYLLSDFEKAQHNLKQYGLLERDNIEYESHNIFSGRHKGPFNVIFALGTLPCELAVVRNQEEFLKLDSLDLAASATLFVIDVHSDKVLGTGGILLDWDLDEYRITFGLLPEDNT